MIAVLVILGLFACLVGRQVSATSFSGLQDNRQQETAGKKTEEKSNQLASSATPKVYVASQDEYYIGLQDVLDVKIQDAPELSATYTVGSSGTIEINPFNKKLMALGKTPEQVAAAIKDLLIEEDYLKKPIVNVDVKEYNSRQYYITGSVAKPGFYTIKGKVTMLTLLTLAGGLSVDHGPKALIIRKKTAREIEQETAGSQSSVSENGEKLSENNPPTTAAATTKLEDAADTAKYNKVIDAPINGLDKGILAQDIPLEPGDRINIPQLRTFLIGGEVAAPGPYPLKEGTSLKQAVVLARGLTPNAAPQKAVIFRANQIDGKQEEVRVDLSAIMNGKKPDVVLQAEDLIVIPNSRMKTIGNALLRSFGVQTLTRTVLY
jgi:polysaccharide export outer membrane protein